jgi:hypothetical protein
MRVVAEIGRPRRYAIAQVADRDDARWHRVDETRPAETLCGLPATGLPGQAVQLAFAHVEPTCGWCKLVEGANIVETEDPQPQGAPEDSTAGARMWRVWAQERDDGALITHLAVDRPGERAVSCPLPGAEAEELIRQVAHAAGLNVEITR